MKTQKLLSIFGVTKITSFLNPVITWKFCLVEMTKYIEELYSYIYEIDGKTMETVSDFIFWASKITAGGDHSHEIKRHLLLGRKVMTNLDSILKSRDITLPTKVRLVKAMVFPVVMYGCESWTVKKGWAPKNWCFWTVVLENSWESLGLQGDPASPFWRRSALGFLWTEWCWCWNSSTLATSCEELTHWKRLWCWEGLGARGKGEDRGWDGWMASPTQWTWVWVNSRSWWWTGRPGVLRFMGLQRVGHDWATELNWTDACISVSYTQRYIDIYMFYFLTEHLSLTVPCLFSDKHFSLKKTELLSFHIGERTVAETYYFITQF